MTDEKSDRPPTIKSGQVSLPSMMAGQVHNRDALTPPFDSQTTVNSETESQQEEISPETDSKQENTLGSIVTTPAGGLSHRHLSWSVASCGSSHSPKTGYEHDRCNQKRLSSISQTGQDISTDSPQDACVTPSSHPAFQTFPPAHSSHGIDFHPITRGEGSTDSSSRSKHWDHNSENTYQKSPETINEKDNGGKTLEEHAFHRSRGWDEKTAIPPRNNTNFSPHLSTVVSSSARTTAEEGTSASARSSTSSSPSPAMGEFTRSIYEHSTGTIEGLEEEENCHVVESSSPSSFTGGGPGDSKQEKQNSSTPQQFWNGSGQRTSSESHGQSKGASVSTASRASKKKRKSPPQSTGTNKDSHSVPGKVHHQETGKTNRSAAEGSLSWSTPRKTLHRDTGRERRARQPAQELLDSTAKRVYQPPVHAYSSKHSKMTKKSPFARQQLPECSSLEKKHKGHKNKRHRKKTGGETHNPSTLDSGAGQGVFQQPILHGPFNSDCNEQSNQKLPVSSPPSPPNPSDTDGEDETRIDEKNLDSEMDHPMDELTMDDMYDWYASFTEYIYGVVNATGSLHHYAFKYYRRKHRYLGVATGIINGIGSIITLLSSSKDSSADFGTPDGMKITDEALAIAILIAGVLLLINIVLSTLQSYVDYKTQASYHYDIYQKLRDLRGVISQMEMRLEGSPRENALHIQQKYDDLLVGAPYLNTKIMYEVVKKWKVVQAETPSDYHQTKRRVSTADSESSTPDTSGNTHERHGENGNNHGNGGHYGDECKRAFRLIKHRIQRYILEVCCCFKEATRMLQAAQTRNEDHPEYIPSSSEQAYVQSARNPANARKGKTRHHRQADPHTHNRMKRGSYASKTTNGVNADLMHKREYVRTIEASKVTMLDQQVVVEWIAERMRMYDIRHISLLRWALRQRRKRALQHPQTRQHFSYENSSDYRPPLPRLVAQNQPASASDDDNDYAPFYNAIYAPSHTQAPSFVSPTQEKTSVGSPADVETKNPPKSRRRRDGKDVFEKGKRDILPQSSLPFSKMEQSAALPPRESDNTTLNNSSHEPVLFRASHVDNVADSSCAPASRIPQVIPSSGFPSSGVWSANREKRGVYVPQMHMDPPQNVASTVGGYLPQSDNNTSQKCVPFDTLAKRPDPYRHASHTWAARSSPARRRSSLAPRNPLDSLGSIQTMRRR